MTIDPRTLPDRGLDAPPAHAVPARAPAFPDSPVGRIAPRLRREAGPVERTRGRPARRAAGGRERLRKRRTRLGALTRALLLPATLLVLVLVLACSDPENIVVVTMENGDQIQIELLPRDAPRTVENFRKLVAEGFYDGTTFHLVVPGFMIQGGDPNSRDDIPANDGFGGPGYTIEDEPNDRSHVRGTVSMAKPRVPDSAGSQFFIMLADRDANGQPWSEILDGEYTVFGQVVSGMDVVDRISGVPRGSTGLPLQADRPDEAQVIRSMRLATRRADPTSPPPDS